MSVVLDASLAIAWLFEDECTPAVDAVLTDIGANGAQVPGLWRLEVANAVQMAVRRKRVDAGFRDRALQRLVALPIVVDLATDRHAWTTTLQLADRFGLTLYDAAYLEPAQRHTLPLASLDQELRSTKSFAPPHRWSAFHCSGLPDTGVAARTPLHPTPAIV